MTEMYKVYKLPEYTWGQERELCKRCKHLIERVTGGMHQRGRATSMYCAISTYRHLGKPNTCLDERNRGRCGKEGKNFEPKESGGMGPSQLAPGGAPLKEK